ncbi:MAG: glycosyltransferase, partial [Bryobacteraceae bacterium]
SMIWRRYAEHAGNPIRRAYFALQARRMEAFEGAMCRTARLVISVSQRDSETMRERFGLSRAPFVPTGVDANYFRSPGSAAARWDLVFLGSLDWLPNVDAMRFFVRDVLPILRRARPDCTVAIVGRRPPPEVEQWGREDARITVTGTVDDVRPYLWQSAVSIVPLRIGGGTRLKIYEAMAAGIPVVSTAVGAEGLDIDPPRDIRIADSAAQFAAACTELLAGADIRRRMADAARVKIEEKYSWEQVCRQFERLLESG